MLRKIVTIVVILVLTADVALACHRQRRRCHNSQTVVVDVVASEPVVPIVVPTATSITTVDGSVDILPSISHGVPTTTDGGIVAPILPSGQSTRQQARPPQTVQPQSRQPQSRQSKIVQPQLRVPSVAPQRVVPVPQQRPQFVPDPPFAEEQLPGDLDLLDQKPDEPAGPPVSTRMDLESVAGRSVNLLGAASLFHDAPTFAHRY